MDPFPVVVKHAGQKHNLEFDPSATGETFKYQVFSVTNVEPERQKIIVKGGQLKDDQDLSKLGVKPGHTFMMMGTPSGGSAAILKPKQETKFLEDMTEAEAAQAEGATPAGLQNLGNTCYMNATLQTLRSIPELQEQLRMYRPRQVIHQALHTCNEAYFSFSGPSNGAGSSVGDLSQFGLGGLGSSGDLTASLRDLYKQMSETQEGFPPWMFLNAFRTQFPQFAERSRDGRGYAQQDAEEAWSQLITTLKGKLKPQAQSSSNDGETSAPNPFVDEFLGGRFVRIEECVDQEAKEAGETSQPKDDETFYKLNCHVASKEISHLREGVTAALSDTYEKKSPTLNKDVEYVTTSRIARLPKYLPVHFVRFFWKRDVGKKAKILRKVSFPHELDCVEYCTDELRQQLIPVRDKIRDVRKEQGDFERARKRQKKMQKAEEADVDRQFKAKGPAGEKEMAAEKKEATDRQPKSSSKANGDVEMKEGESFKTDAQVEKEHATRIATLKRDLLAKVSSSLSADKGANQTGLYELRGVVTHQGASADSGHYTAYVKKEGRKISGTDKREEEDGKWWWFNDEKVSEVEAEKIDQLAGGGESHSALILLYRAVDLPELSDQDQKLLS